MGALNDKKVQAAKPKEKPYKLYDGNGLFLLVTKAGAKSWRVRYTMNGTQKLLTLGRYPMLTLADARERCINAKRLLADGIDPAAEKQAQKKEDARQAKEDSLTFAKVADDFCRVHATKTKPSTHETLVERLRLHILPMIGATPFAKLTFEDLKAITLRLEKDGKLEMAYRVAVIINQICRYARVNQWAAHNIADGLTAVVAKRPAVEKQGRPAITDAAGVAAMLQRLEDYIAVRRVSPTMAAALRLFPLLALRSQELLGAMWQDVDFNKAMLSIPTERMKGGKPHDVPLSRQATGILQGLYERRADNRFVFRSGGKTGHFSSEAVNKAMHGAGIPLGEMCLHGWRKVFSTICHEAGAPAMLVEKCLAHATGNTVAMAYNKAQYQDARRILMQWWADTLDALRDGTVRPRLELERAAMFV